MLEATWDRGPGATGGTMSTRRRWIAVVALLLGSIAVLRAQDQRGPAQPATVTFIIEGMT